MIIQCPKTGRTCEVTGCKGCWKSEQAEQEPVAWIKLNEDGVYIEDVTGFPVYANPVRTKDLTDEELWEAAKTAKSNDLTDAFRAVIAADRENNK